MQKIVNVMFFLMVLVLASCSTVPKEIVTVKDDPTLKLVEQSAKKIEKSLSQLVRLESSNRHGGIIMVVPKKGEMAKQITISWNGALKPILENLSRSIKYKVEYTGEEPATPLTVVINEMNSPVYTVLENISWQVSPKVEMIVNPIKKVLKVAYTNHFYQRNRM